VTVDILIAAGAFLIWMIVEARRLGMRHWCERRLQELSTHGQGVMNG
jgi:hypothetical protein